MVKRIVIVGGLEALLLGLIAVLLIAKPGDLVVTRIAGGILAISAILIGIMVLKRKTFLGPFATFLGMCAYCQ